MKILTVKLLDELISSGDVSKIKMKTRSWGDRRSHTSETKLWKDGGFEVDRRAGYIILKWHTCE